MYQYTPQLRIGVRGGAMGRILHTVVIVVPKWIESSPSSSFWSSHMSATSTAEISFTLTPQLIRPSHNQSLLLEFSRSASWNSYRSPSWSSSWTSLWTSSWTSSSSSSWSSSWASFWSASWCSSWISFGPPPGLPSLTSQNERLDAHVDTYGTLIHTRAQRTVVQEMQTTRKHRSSC